MTPAPSIILGAIGWATAIACAAGWIREERSRNRWRALAKQSQTALEDAVALADAIDRDCEGLVTQRDGWRHTANTLDAEAARLRVAAGVGMEMASVYSTERDVARAEVARCTVRKRGAHGYFVAGSAV